MKQSIFVPPIRFALLLTGFAALLAAFTVRADQVKANNNTALQSGGSWVSGTAPEAGDNAIWNSAVATAANCTNTLGSAVTWKGISITNPSAPVSINGSTTLTLNNGINMASATENLILNCGTVAVASNQTWTVASGMTLATGSATNAGSVNAANNFVTLAGGGAWLIGGTGDNGSLGITVNAGTVELNKTSTSGAHAVGGPGLTVNSGAAAQLTGTGGDQIYNGASVTVNGTFDLYGNSETINGLNGSGTVTTTLANGTPTLTLGGMGGSGNFTGTIEAAANSSITLTTSNVQSVARITRGSGAAGPFINANAGTLTLNGAADNAYASATVASGATLQLAKASGSGAHAIGNGLTINSGGTVQITGTGGDQINNGNSVTISGTLDLNGNSETIGSLSFSGGTLQNSSRATATLTDGGNLTMNGNVPINDPNAAPGTTVILQYAGTRSGTGAFVAGALPAGATVVDNPSAQTVSIVNSGSSTFPQVIIPSLNTNEIVVAATTPQQYGAHGDGITDDSAAFQNAMNAVYNSGGFGGGVVYVPAGNYAFYTNLNIPTGVTLHGNWTDWTTGAKGLAGTTFKVYFGAGQTTNTPFITLNGSTALRDVNIWYPNQNPDSITPYPFSIGLNQDCVVQNVALVNSYQGIESTPANGGDKHILSTIVGSPLSLGISLNQIFDVCHAEDIRFSPAAWAASLATNAPAAGGSYAAWMRSNGEAMKLLRVDGEMCFNTCINGYNVGIEANAAPNGQPGVTFYTGSVSNCATALLAQDMPGAFGLMFANFTLDGDIAIRRTNTADDANAMFDHCVITGRKGPAVSATGADWGSWMQFQNCTISNALSLAGPGVFNVVDSTLLGSTQCVMSATATRAAFTGCSFRPIQNIVNNGNPGNLLISSQPSISNAFPVVYWTNVLNDYLSCRPANTSLYIATAYGAAGNGSSDDTAAIQTALAAAGANGGGIVYLPAGWYHLTNTLSVPSGVKLQGAFEMRHGTWPGADGIAKGTVLQPYGGQGTTNGPVAVALAANSGLVGVTISYENQNSNCMPFPAAIQGQGGNVYIIGVCSPNPYSYVDLDTFTCTNHFIDMVDGWAINRGFTIGNGSSGSIVDCHDNWTYWVDNFDSKSQLPQSVQEPVLEYVDHNLQMYVLGNCTEQLIKDFSIIENTFVHTIAEDGKAPNLTLINDYCDASIQGFILDSSSSSTLNAVNTPMTPFNFNNDSDLANATVGVISTTNYQGTARFFNSTLWGGSHLDFNINGGDVGFDGVHLQNNSILGSTATRGVFHLINSSANASGSPVYNVTFGTNAGTAGTASEFAASFAYNGCSVNNINVTNAISVWMDYALSSYNVLNVGAVIIGDVYPNGVYQFQAAGTLSFMAYSTNGINSSSVTVQLTGTNLLGQGYVTNYTTANGLTVTGTSTTRSVSAPLVTNVLYLAVIQVTDAGGNAATNTVSFDTIAPACTFEAEDFDYNSGNYINNPQTNAYTGLSGTAGIDYSNGIPGEGSASYRPQGLETEGASDKPRQGYGTGLPDYDVGFANSGNWGNYTRSFPAGTYNIYMRGASANGPTTDSASMSLVTSGRGTSTQATTKLGAFSVPNTGSWQTYIWAPLLDTNGNLVEFTGGSVETLRTTIDNGGNNVNFYLLVATNTQIPLPPQPVTESEPVVLQMIMQRTATNQSLILQWPGTNANDSASQSNVYYAPDLAPAAPWTLLTNAPVFSNGWWTVTLPMGTNSGGFYRLK